MDRRTFMKTAAAGAAGCGRHEGSIGRRRQRAATCGDFKRQRSSCHGQGHVHAT